LRTAMRVLYADDNPLDRDLTASHFENTGFAIDLEMVGTGRECLARLADGDYDALLLDNHLPDIDGIEVLRRLSQTRPTLPVVVVTGVGDEALAVQVLRLGAADYVPKAGEYRARLPAVLKSAIAAVQQRAEHGNPGVRSRRILYVEHNPADVDLTIRHFAAEAPYVDLHCVRSAEEALALVPDGSFDLVLADLRLPDMSALDLLREIRHADVQVPFVVITGRGDEATAVAALKLGALDYMVKRENYLTQLPYAIENAITRAELARTNDRLHAELSEKDRLAEENARLLEGAQQALRTRDEFLAIAAHEIRGPLMALRLAVQSLQRGKIPEARLLMVLDIIAREDRKLANFVDELLDLGRIRAGTLHMLFETVDLGEVVAYVLSRFGGELLKSGSTVSVVSSGELQGQWDRSRLEQVVTNLLSNAIKFGLGRPIDVTMEGTPTEGRLRFADQGVGIPKAVQNQIFEPFERELSVRNYGGMGLGLYIVRTIVNGLQGSLHVDSEPGHGATFTIVLPKVRHE